MSDYSNPTYEMFANADSPVSTRSFQRVEMQDADVIVCERFFEKAKGNKYFKQLNENAAWKQEKITLFGRHIDLPRLTAWYGDEGTRYKYSGITLSPEPWTATLLEIKRQIEAVSAISFNSVLLTKYRNERDSVAWHSDDEPELGHNPVIGSVSFGATRTLKFKHKTAESQNDVALPHGSYLLMRGTTQHHWLHRISKQWAPLGVRINLTFRIIR